VFFLNFIDYKALFRKKRMVNFIPDLNIKIIRHAPIHFKNRNDRNSGMNIIPRFWHS